MKTIETHGEKYMIKYEKIEHNVFTKDYDLLYNLDVIYIVCSKESLRFSRNFGDTTRLTDRPYRLGNSMYKGIRRIK